MSQSRIFNIPKFKAHEKDEDKFEGWYRYDSQNHVALRVGNSDIGLDGEIRFNRKTKQFEGYNGNRWIILDSSKGDTGQAGKDFNEVVEFVCDEKEEGGFVIQPSKLEPNKGDSSIKVRKLISAIHNINNEEKKDITITENESNIRLSVNSKPHVWDCGNIVLDTLHRPNPDGTLKCYGDTAIFLVHEEVKRGQFVQLVIEANRPVIKPLTYKNNGHAPNLFGEAPNIVGVALENAKPMHACKVCCSGITCVMVSNESSYLQIDNNVRDGNNGLINHEGKVVKTNRKPLQPYIKAGNFLGNHTITKNKLVPFRVNISIIDE